MEKYQYSLNTTTTTTLNLSHIASHLFFILSCNQNEQRFIFLLASSTATWYIHTKKFVSFNNNDRMFFQFGSNWLYPKWIKRKIILIFCLIIFNNNEKKKSNKPRKKMKFFALTNYYFFLLHIIIINVWREWWWYGFIYKCW